MPSRRAHTKSRHGCAHCKAKRIKCDEARPRCGKCTAGDLDCSYGSFKWTFTVAEPSKNSVPQQGSVRPDLGSAELHNLELMVQWCNHTHLTLSRSDSVVWIWRSAIPRKAAHYPFLMHGILGLSALHSAFSSAYSERTRYLQLAQIHHSKAIEGLGHLDNLNHLNADAAYALSNIIIIFTFALPLCTQPSSTCDPIREFVEIAHISKGSMKVLMEVHHWVEAGDLAALVTMPEPLGGTSTDRGQYYEQTVAPLECLNKNRSHKASSSNSTTYGEAIEALQMSFGSMESHPSVSVITAAFQFIFRVPPDFLNLVEQDDAFSLVILASYGVIMHRLRAHWWMGDWGHRLVRKIDCLLDDPWRLEISRIWNLINCTS